MQKQQGLIAILDALGAANYNDREISQFLRSRDRVLELLAESQCESGARRYRGNLRNHVYVQ